WAAWSAAGTSARSSGALTSRSLLDVIVVEARHLVGGRNPEQPERVGEPDAARLRQPEPSLREPLVLADHAAVPVEAVEVLGEVADPRRDPVGGPQLGRFADDLRVQRQRAE